MDTRRRMGTLTASLSSHPRNPNSGEDMAAAEPRRAHDLNVRRVPHALRGDICVRVDTTCLGPDKSPLIDTEKGADKRPSGAGERCTMPGTGTTRKGGGSREAGGSGVAFKDTSAFHIYKKKKEQNPK